MPTSAFKRQLLHGASTNGLTNAVANGGICWLLVKDNGPITWWGSSNFGGDLLATGFLLPFIVALIVIPLQQRKVRNGKVCAIPPEFLGFFLGRVTALPNNLWARAVIFGTLGAFGIALPTLGLLALLEITSFNPGQYAVFKGLWAGLLAAVLVMPMIAAGMTQPAALNITATGKK